jgi:Flp pilus assembly pilin Flp
MKLFTNLKNRLRKNLIKNERGQGATEYILILVVVVGLVTIFKKPITEALKTKTDKLGGDITSFEGGE